MQACNYEHVGVMLEHGYFLTSLLRVATVVILSN